MFEGSKLVRHIAATPEPDYSGQPSSRVPKKCCFSDTGPILLVAATFSPIGLRDCHVQIQRTGEPSDMRLLTREFGVWGCPLTVSRLPHFAIACGASVRHPPSGCSRVLIPSIRCPLWYRTARTESIAECTDLHRKRRCQSRPGRRQSPENSAENAVFCAAPHQDASNCVSGRGGTRTRTPFYGHGILNRFPFSF